jgi:tetratricopeptide (TPR) repeat protein
VDRPTDSLEAWEAYLQARSIVNQTPEYNPAKYQRAEPWIEKAVAADPGFAEAWAMLSEIQLQGIWMGYANTDTQRQLARESLERAESLAPRNAGVIRARAEYEYRVNLNYELALELLEEARLLEPGNAETLTYLAITLRRVGRWEEAVNTFLQAMALDPLNSFAAMTYTETLLTMHAFDRLETELDRWLLRYPGSSNLISQKIQLLILGRGQIDEAQAYFASLPADVQQAQVTDALTIAYFSRDWDTVTAILEQLPEGFVTLPIYHATRNFLLGSNLFTQGKAESARPYLEAYRDNFMSQDGGSRAGNAFRLSQLAQVQIMLGDTESALSLATEASALPLEKDWMFGQSMYRNGCWILAMAGQRDRALECIAEHLDQPVGYTRWELYLDPAWDFFRDDPRFVELSLPDGVEPEPFRAQRLGDGT